jgi:hypothetical protein
MYFPKQMEGSIIMAHCMGQIRLATKDGLKGKDDFLDTISQLGYLEPWKPTEAAPTTPIEVDRWELEAQSKQGTPLDSYIV